MHSTLLRLLCCAALCMQVAAMAESRSFIDQNGRILPAEALGVDHGRVSLKLKDGPTVQVSLSQLSEVDQNYLREKFPAAAFPHQADITVEWRTSIGPNSGKVRKTTGKTYKLSESQTMDFSLTNQSATPLANLQIGYRVYLVGEDGNLDPAAKPAVSALQPAPILQPKQTVVVATREFDVSSVVTGPTPAIHVTQAQRMKVMGVIAVLFEDGQPIYQLVSPGLEQIWKAAGVGNDGLAIPLIRQFQGPGK